MAARETAAHLVTEFAGRARAFVQVQQGCDHRCTFCIIPFGRGPNRSVPVGAVVAQVRALVARGYREVVLTGVDIASYADSALRSTKRVCGNGPSGGVNEQQHAVDHGQSALHLTAEIGVARRVDDVDDGHRTVRVLAVHRGVLGQDRDALFLLQVTGVHEAFNRVVAAMSQCAGLPQHRIDQGRLAVIDVSDDGDVSEIHAGDCFSAGRVSRKN